MYDRMVVGGALPVGEVLTLEAIDPLKAPFFLTRREMGIYNVGGPGIVKAGDAEFELDYKEALYLGSGDRVVTFESKDATHPAKFYFNSLTAHRNYPDRKVTKAGVAYLPVADGYDGTRSGKCVEHDAGTRTQPSYGSLLLFRNSRRSCYLPLHG